MQRILVVGDIHGCFSELQALLEAAGWSDGDALIAIGDAVDRGPETPQVVEFFQSAANARSLMGNHERKHVRAVRHEVRLSLSQQVSQFQLASAYPAALSWMAALPLWIELPEALLVHGYVEPGVALERQNPGVLCGTMGGEKLLRERYDRPWYDLVDLEKPVIVGHKNYTRTDQPFVYRDRIYGLDTDCVTGKALTGLWLPEFRFVSVPSRGNLWAQVRRAYLAARPRPVRVPRPAPPAWSEAHTQELRQLLELVQAANRRILAQVQQEAGYAELTPRQQSRRYSERAGHGALTTLLHLARVGKLDEELARKIVVEPERIRRLMEEIAR